MALFSKDTDKTAKPEPISISNAASISPSPAPLAAPSEPVKPAPSKANGAAVASADNRAYLDRGTKISGKLHFEGPARIDGEVDGEINGKETLTVGETAVVAAQVRAASVVVAGKVNGDIIASQRIEIRPSAKVVGNLTAPTLVIHEGAHFEGHCSMHADARDDRKVTVFPKEERLQVVGGSKPA